MYEVRTIECVCGSTVRLESADVNECPGCEREYNAFGQKVNGSLRDIDPADAGEYWEED